MKHKISILMTMVFFSSCMKITAKDQEEKTNSVGAVSLALQPTAFTEQIKYIYTQSGQLQFIFPSAWPKEVRVVMNDATKKEFNLDDRRKLLPAVNESTVFQFYSENQLLDEVQVLPAVELNVSGRVLLKEKLNLSSKAKSIYFKNLYLASDSELILEDFSGTLIIENLQSQNGTMATFFDEAISTPNLFAKSGGKVLVEVKNGQGSINFLAKGENGADGLNGKPADASLNGKNGERGQAAEFSVQNAGGTSATEDNPGCVAYAHSCSKNPSYGTSGQPGKRGYPGENGQDGGKSGAFIINSQANDLKVSIQVREASGGRAGAGGTGGQGGQAGPSADGTVGDLNFNLSKVGESCTRSTGKNSCIDEKARKCHVVKYPCTSLQGIVPKNGEPGPRGVDGAPGNIGQKETSCLYQKSQLVQCFN